MRSPNEDHVLHSFYQERQARPNTPKRHSLLQKNLPFSSAVPPLPPPSTSLPISRVPSAKEAYRKRSLDEYENNLRSLTFMPVNTMPLWGENSVQNIQTENLKDRGEHRYRSGSCYLQKNRILEEEDTFRLKSHEDKENLSFFASPPEHNEENKVQYSSPNFRMSKQLTASPTDLDRLESPTFNNKMDSPHEHHSQVERRLEREVRELKEQLAQMRAQREKQSREHEQLAKQREREEKERKKEQKFISSLQKMRKTIEKVDEECSLRELWRWVKALPN